MVLNEEVKLFHYLTITTEKSGSLLTTHAFSVYKKYLEKVVKY